MICVAWLQHLLLAISSRGSQNGSKNDFIQLFIAQIRKAFAPQWPLGPTEELPPEVITFSPTHLS